jgi:hypothetical protein
MALFHDVVQGPGYTTAAVANAVALPDMTFPASQSGWLITRIWVTAAIINHNVAEPLVGYVRVTSEDCLIEPFHIPLEPVPGFVTVGASVQREPHKWIANVSIPGGGVLSFDVVGDVGQTTAPEVQVTVEFTDGGSGGQQLHMKCGAAPATLGTADNAEIALNDIEIKASRLYMVFGYAIALQPTADEACPTTVEVKSTDFAEAGPFKFAWNPLGGMIANGASGGVDLTTIETDRSFKSPGQKQTLQCNTTTRDAMAGNGRANWGVVYS